MNRILFAAAASLSLAACSIDGPGLRADIGAGRDVVARGVLLDYLEDGSISLCIDAADPLACVEARYGEGVLAAAGWDTDDEQTCSGKLALALNCARAAETGVCIQAEAQRLVEVLNAYSARCGGSRPADPG